MLRYCAVGGAVALTSAVITWAIVRPSPRQVSDEAASAPVAPSISVSRNGDASQAEAAVQPPDPKYDTEVNEPTLPAAPAAVRPPSPPSQVSVSPENDPSRAEAAVPSSDPNQLTKTDEPMPQVEPTPAATVPPPPPSQMSVGPSNDPARVGAEVPPSVPKQLTKTIEPAGQAEPTPAATVPPSTPSKPQVASAPAGAAPISGPQSPPPQAGGTATRLDAEEIATLVYRGTDLLKGGDVASARLVLRRAADAGSASAALMLGSTFDPLFIQQLGAIGVVPDIAQARQWYEKAAALGSEAASQRLAKLAHTGQ